MKLVTLRDGTRDGALYIAAEDLTHAAPAAGIACTLQAAIDAWEELEPRLRELADAVARGTAPGQASLDLDCLAAPLPRAWQWLDGSAYPSHGALMQRAFNLPPIETDRPLMYQGMSDAFLSWNSDVPLPSEADGIDFEAEFGVITGTVAMGTSKANALGAVRLVVIINDWSLRAIAPLEMKTGFGWVQAKPACAMGPVALTPDELAGDWQGGRVNLTMRSELNDAWFGTVPGAEGMDLGFDELIAHAARTRTLAAGTVIGSGTVSSARYSEVGSSCIAERRAIEMIEAGKAATPFMRFGDNVRLSAHDRHGRAPFGEIRQTVRDARAFGERRCEDL